MTSKLSLPAERRDLRPFVGQDFVTATCIGVRGEFGNQLFQVAAVLAYAHRHKRQAIFKPWLCNHSTRDYSSYFPGLQYRSSVEPRNFYEELRFAYDEIPFRPALDLIGSFQSEKYFYEIREQVKALFREPEDIAVEVTRFLEVNGLTDFSALQMRYFDRDVIDQTTQVFSLPEHYFVEAARQLGKDRKILIVTNSPTRGGIFAKKHLQSHDYVVASNRNSLVDFYLLTRASKICISNSTFGWWGAYLNPHVDQVYAPTRKKWFNFPYRSEKRWSTEDLYPSNFVEIPF